MSGPLRLSARERKTRFQIAAPLSCQKTAAGVWLGVRTVLVSEPTRFTSRKSRV
jgi:hypothetical protein